MIKISLPDGSQREYPGPLTVAEVAASIGAGLAKAALGGRIGQGADARLVDTSFLIDADAPLAIVTDKDADGLEMIRHSTAHLLAYAVKELFPDAQVTIGPAQNPKTPSEERKRKKEKIRNQYKCAYLSNKSSNANVFKELDMNQTFIFGNAINH